MASGSLMISSRTIGAVLSLALVLLTTRVQAAALDATCTGEPDRPWRKQIAGCTKAIKSGKYAGKDLAKAFAFRSRAHVRTGDIDRSLADIEQAIRLDPRDASAFNARGDLYFFKGDRERALADYTKAISLEPASAGQAFINRGMVHLTTGDFDRAVAEFGQAVRLEPASAEALYWRGMASRLKGDTAAADADIAAAKKIDPGVDR